MKRKWISGITALMLCMAGCLPVAMAQPEMAEGITHKCRITVSEGDPAVLTDKALKTHWAPSAAHGRITIDLPDRPAGGLSVSWFAEPEDYLISAKDKNGNECNRFAKEKGFAKIKDFFELAPDVRKITIDLKSPKDSISELNVFGQGTLLASVQVWENPAKRADLMVVSAHEDDELLWFGGTIPTYAVDQGKRTVVVYMANCGRLRCSEAMNGLWAMGIKNHPVFNHFPDKRSRTLEEGLENWGGEDAVVAKLVENIRQYKPSVVVSHDINGEYGHGAHKATAYAVQKAVGLAQDATKYPESAQAYGTWQVKKLYLHLYHENPIEMDWHQPLQAYGGKTGYEMACIGYAEHKSQQDFYQMQQGGKYDNAKFGLAYTTVGQDTGKRDFFEHIPHRGAVSGGDEGPSPGPEESPAPVPAKTDQGRGITAVLLIAALLVLGGAGWFAWYQQNRCPHKVVQNRRRNNCRR